MSVSFEEAWETANKIPGWLCKQDALVIWDLCQKINSNVVEVGSFLGKSSVLISHSKNVICIDPWIAGEKMQKNIKTKVPVEIQNLSFFKQFQFYTKKTKFAHRIHDIRAYDYDVFCKWKQKIDFLFLDHLHTEQAVIDSLLGWKPFLNTQSKILIHDANVKEVMDGIKKSGILLNKIFKESEFMPALCSWPKIHI